VELVFWAQGEECWMIELELLQELSYETAAFDGGVTPATLEILTGHALALPTPLEALILTSGLQGREPEPPEGHRCLLGVALAEQLLYLYAEGKLPSPDRVGVVLAGNLFADPKLEARGVSGDVTEVFEAFAHDFRWVVGVLGNHDALGDRERIDQLENVHVLERGMVELDGLRIAGFGGIMGRSTKTDPIELRDYLDPLRQQAKWGPDLLVLHQGPSVREEHRIGSDEIRQLLDETQPSLVVAGHYHWKTPAVELTARTTVINVDARVVVLTAAPMPG
jgi:hypothetical protein